MKSFKISIKEKLDKMEKDVLNKFNKIMEMLSANKIADTEFDTRKHEVSSLDNEPSIDEDVNPFYTSSNKATNFIEKPHFSSHFFTVRQIHGVQTNKRQNQKIARDSHMTKKTPKI